MKTIGVGIGLLAMSAAFYVQLERDTQIELARTPRGEDNLGIAVIGMMWGLPMLATALAGLLTLLGAFVLMFRARRDQSN